MMLKSNMLAEEDMLMSNTHHQLALLASQESTVAAD